MSDRRGREQLVQDNQSSGKRSSKSSRRNCKVLVFNKMPERSRKKLNVDIAQVDHKFLFQHNTGRGQPSSLLNNNARSRIFSEDDKGLQEENNSEFERGPD